MDDKTRKKVERILAEHREKMAILREVRDSLVDAIDTMKLIQWVGIEKGEVVWCPICGVKKPWGSDEPHADGCKVAEHIAEMEEYLAEELGDLPPQP